MKTHWLRIFALLSCLMAIPAWAAPGDVLFFDNFERVGVTGGSNTSAAVGNGWTVTPGNNACSGKNGAVGCAGIDTDGVPWDTGAVRAFPGSKSLFLRWSTVTVDTPTISLAGRAAAELSFKLRRGSDCFSEWPANNRAGCNQTINQYTPANTNEEFQVQYKNSAGAWVALAQYPSDGAPGENLTPSIPLPDDALHANFKVRFFMPNGSGNGGTSGGAPGVIGYDYWHVDDVAITEVSATSYGGPFCDTFESGLSRWRARGVGDMSIGTTYKESGAQGMDLRWGNVQATIYPIDMTSASGNITYWVKRGTGNVTQVPNTTGSDQPESGENLVVTYLDKNGAWQQLASYSGGSTGGQVFNASHAITGQMKHNAFRIRFELVDGDNTYTYDQDYWHVDNVCVGVRLATSDWSLAMTRNGELVPGQNTSYTLNASNGGPDTDDGELTLTSTLPSGLSYASASGSGWTCSAVGQTVTCLNPGPHAPGVVPALTLNVAVSASASGALTHSATVSGNTLDNTQANNTVTDTYTIEADLALSKTRGADLVAGQNATYTLAVTNNGPSAAGTLTVVDTLPSALSYVSASGTGWSCSRSGQTVTCTHAGTHAAGAQPALGLTVAVAGNASGAVTNNATVSSPTLDTVSANDSASDTFVFPLTAYAYYKMDEATWSGTTGEVKDDTAAARNATALGGINTIATPAAGNKGDTCRGADIPADNNSGNIKGINTGIDVNSLVNNGTISFWYKSNKKWAANDNTDRILLDATTRSNYDFYLRLRDDGRLRFQFDDSNANRVRAQNKLNTNTKAGEWKFIAVTWDASTNRVRVYVDGVLDTANESTQTFSTSSRWGMLHIGDTISGLMSGGYRDSADGIIDEVRVYDFALSAAQIQGDMAMSHSCNSLDHFKIEHSGSGVNCQAEPVTFTAHNSGHAGSTLSSGTVIDISTSTNHGDWSISPGQALGTLTNNGNGSARYVTGAESSFVLKLKDTFAETVNINLLSGTATERSGTASADVPYDANLAFAPSGLRIVNAAGGSIATQVAGVDSATHYLEAIRTDTNSAACVNVFASNTDVSGIELASECVNPVACQAGQAVTLTNNGNAGTIAANNQGAVSAYTSRTLRFGANARAALTFRYSDVGNIKLHARYNIPRDTTPAALSGNLMTGSSNAFVVQPHHFDLDAIQSSGGTANPAAADATGNKFVRAGEAFSVRVTARNGLNAPTPNYGKEQTPETVNLTANLVAPAAGAAPALSGSFGAFNNGVATGSNFAWNEVGVITLTPSANYLGAGTRSGNTSVSVGRFYPASFVLSGGTLANRTDLASCAVAGCGTFTYAGEQMDALFTLTAVGMDGSTTMQNYATSATAAANFAKLNPLATVTAGSGGPLNLAAVNQATPRTPVPACAVTPAAPCLTPQQATAGSFSGGVANVRLPFSVYRSATTPVGPFDALNVGIAPQDSDGVTMSSYDIDTVNVVAGANNHRRVATTGVRYGRLSLQNAAGTELLPLAVSAQAEYWNGTYWVSNAADSQTVVDTRVSPTGNLSVYNLVGIPSLTAQGAGAVTMNAGQFGFFFNPSGVRGSADFRFDAPAYLPSNTARAMFNVYQGAKELIYMRESY